MYNNCVVLLFLTHHFTPAALQDRNHWYQQAKATLIKNVETTLGDVPPKAGMAKNVILFVGDGMGISTVTASRIFRGQLHGLPGEDSDLAFDKFENVALVKTYNTDSQVGDSGACATALICGVKARLETVGVDNNALFGRCPSTFLSRVPCLMDWAQEEGKSTGFVTNTRVTHATPAALYAHSASRYWESDDKLPSEARGLCKDIARQLVENEPGKHFNVILGGGRRHFLPQKEGSRNLGQGQGHQQGKRRDERNLIETWLQDKKSRDLSAKYVFDKSGFEKVNASSVDYLLGLFAESHLNDEVDRDRSPGGEPSLAEMTTKAVQILRKNPRGFLLFVEGGKIDHAHHMNNAYRAITETLAFEEAVIAGQRLTDPNNTLLVVTADHSHVFTFGGFPNRGNPILGTDSRNSDVDDMPYTTLLYANGPGYKYHSKDGKRVNLTSVDTMHKDFRQQSAVPRKWDTHGGEDVPLYAHGVKSYLFKGVIEQSYVPHALAFAACIGPFKSFCTHRPEETFGCNNIRPLSRKTFADRNTGIDRNSTPFPYRLVSFLVLINVLFGC